MAPPKPFTSFASPKPLPPIVPKKLTLKLLTDKNEHKVLFAEAGKDFVDFLFFLLSLPLAIVAKLLVTDGKMTESSLVSQDMMVGSLFHVYQSVENLGDMYMESSSNKETLLRLNESTELLDIKPEPSSTALRLLSPAKKLYSCPTLNHRGYVTDDPRTNCPICGTCMTTNVAYVPPPPSVGEAAASSNVGYVKDTLTYLVMDDLDVKPLASIISTRDTLIKFFYHELEEKVVHLGMDEGLKMLKALMQSRTVLTDVFLGDKANKEIQETLGAIF